MDNVEDKNLKVEKHLVKQTSKVFTVIDSNAFLSKNLYNAANYILRQVFIFGYKLKNNEVTEDKLPEGIKELFKSLNSALVLYDKNRMERYNEKIKNGKVKEKVGKRDKIISIEEQKPKESKPFGATNYVVGYEFLDFYMKNNVDYKSVVLVQGAQQILKVLLKDWQSFFKGIKAYKVNPAGFKAPPSIPNYKNTKTGRNNIYLTNQNAFIKDGYLVFPRHLKELNNTFKTDIKADALQMVRIRQVLSCYEVEIVYKDAEDKSKTSIDVQKIQYKSFYNVVEKTRTEVNPTIRVGAGDLGIDNFVTITNNTGIIPFVVSGKEIKTINQLYNKQISELRVISDSVRARRKNQHQILKELKDYGYKVNDFDELLDKITKRDIIVDSVLNAYILNSIVTETESTQADVSTKEYKRLTLKRNNRITDFMHKTSRFIANFAKQNNFNVFVVGWNKGIKQDSDMGTKNNQNFCSIPFRTFTYMLNYKLNDFGIKLIIREESYTSQSSFLDNDYLPTYGDSNILNFSGTRSKKSYKSKKNGFIHADVNGSYNILRKEFEDFNILNNKYIKDKWLFKNPIKVNMQIRSFYPMAKFERSC